MNKEQIKQLALDSGFELKPQPDGTMDLHPYVYQFAAKLLPKGTFFYLDADGVIFNFHNEHERNEAAENSILALLGEEWDESVDQIVAGVITHRASQTDLKRRPDDSELDENGCDDEGFDWQDFLYVCNYKLKEVGGKDE